MKKLTALIAAAALLGTTTLAPAAYVPFKSGLTDEIELTAAASPIVPAQAKDKDKDKDKDKMGKDKAKPKKSKKKDKDKDKMGKDKDKDKGKG